MACLHRFLGLHIEDSLFPDWGGRSFVHWNIQS